MKQFLPLAAAIAQRVKETLPGCVKVDVNDLRNEGVIGLVDATKKFDPSKGVKFSTYAKFRIRGAIIDALRANDSLSRDDRRTWTRAEKRRLELEQETGNNVTTAEVAQSIGVRLATLSMIETHALGPLSCSGDGLEANEAAEVVLQDQGPTPEQRHHQGESIALVRAMLSKLPVRTQRLLALYYLEDLNMKQVGERLGVNESRVSQLHSRALSEARKMFALHGYSSAVAF